MTRNNRLPAASAAFVLGGLLLAGCTPQGALAADSEPSTPRSASLPPTPTPTSAAAVVVKPAQPTAMADQGITGAEAAAAYFFQLDHYAQSTGETEDLSLMSHATCEPCTERVEQAQMIATDGYMFIGGEITTRVIEAYAQDPATGIWPLDLEVTENDTVIARPDGSIALSADASVFTKRVEVAVRDGRWVMFAIGPIPEH